MSDRIKLTQDIFMNLDGQPTFVLSGSVIDVPNRSAFHPAHYTTVAEAPSALVAKGPTAVRSVRKR